MAIHLHMNNKNLDNQEESEVHFMPCKIQGDESAKVSSFFKPYIREVDKKCHGSFRGYPLEGEKIIVPAEYKGMIVKESEKTNTESKNRQLYTIGTFSKFTYWNYDKTPSDNDAFLSLLDWIDVAGPLHSSES